MEINISEARLVYAPKMTEAVARWGVYAIPRMWRAPGGELVVRFNGEEDSADTENMQRAPNLYFVSKDNGETWDLCRDGDSIYSISALTGIDPPYLRLKNGDKVFVNSVSGLPPITDTPHKAEFISPCRDGVIRSYRWGDLSPLCRRLQFGRIAWQDGEVDIFDTELDFPEREIHVISQAMSNGSFVKVDEYVRPFIFRLPYFSALCETESGELVAVCCGQNPSVSDKSYTEVYLICSCDGGKSWQKRATVAGGLTDMPYGYGGDGCEISLTIDNSGRLYCVMRTDMSSDPRTEPHPTDTLFCSSNDGGYTWSAPKSIADSSVTPHIVALDGALILIYGRPGVHIKYSLDCGKSWSAPITVIGKTLEEERASGRDDFTSKYGDPDSYCNTFYERISDNEIILLYNDMKYPDENGVPTKAAFVKKIRVDK